MTHSQWRIALLVLLLLCFGGFAHAQDPQFSSTRSAKQFFDEGLTLADRGEFEAAIVMFEAAHKLKPHELVLYNIAHLYDRLENAREALKHYQSFLDASKGRPNSEKVRGARQRVNRLKTSLSAKAATANAKPSEVPEGKFPLPAILKLEGHPSHAKVLLDGQTWSGRSQLSPGWHDLQILAKGFKPWRELIETHPGETYRLGVRLDESAPRARSSTAPPPRARAETRGGYTRTLAYTIGSTGIVLVGVSVATFWWNQGRFEDWQDEDEALSLFADQRLVNEEVFVRRARNQALIENVRAFRVVWIASGAAALLMSGTAAYLLWSNESPESQLTSRFFAGPFGARWESKW